MDAHSFATSLLAALRKLDSRAEVLVCKHWPRNRAAALGVEVGAEFVSVIPLGRASANFNVMSVYRHYKGMNVPSIRGTPQLLAQKLSTTHQHMWVQDQALLLALEIHELS